LWLVSSSVLGADGVLVVEVLWEVDERFMEKRNVIKQKLQL